MRQEIAANTADGLLEVYTGPKVQVIISAWRPAGDKVICGSFCKFFDTDECPYKKGLTPKEGLCPKFCVDATTISGFQTLVEADMALYPIAA